MTAVNAAKAVANANATRSNVPGTCLRNVRSWLEIPARYPDAISAWNAATHKHRGDAHPPAGAPMFFKGGNVHGHIVMSVGAMARSTDTPTSGTVSTRPFDWWVTNWHCLYLGWTEDLNGVLIPWLAPKPPPLPPEPPDMTVAELDAYLASPRGQSRLVAAVLAYKNANISDTDVYGHIVTASGLPLKTPPSP